MLCGSSCNQVRDAEINNSVQVFLTRIIVTKDDVLRHLSKIPECKNARLKEPIVVDVYI